MTLIKSNSFLPTSTNQFFDDFFTKNFLELGFPNNPATRMTLPSVNIIESADEFVVEMAAPGMSKEDFLVELENEILTISSHKEDNPQLENGQTFIRQEYNFQSFKRSFHLPKSVVDESKIKAKYENGILNIMIPKKEEAKTLPPRRIAIN